MDGREVQGLWSSQEAQLHINILEMRAVRYALIEFDLPRDLNSLVSTENVTVVAYINKQGGTRSQSLWKETIPLLDLAIQLNWTLKARHIPGRLNVIADQLSRDGQTIPTEWSLHPEVVDWIFLQMGRPHIDLFATRHNRKLPLFVSPVPDPLAWDTDALSMDWEGLEAYAYPPHQIMTKVLERFRQTKSCRLILVAPRWENQLWFPELLRLAEPDPLPLPLWPTLLKQPQSSIFHFDPGLLKLHAWRLQRRL